MAEIGSEARLLVSSAGRRVQLIDCFRQDAARLGIDLTVIAVDLEPALSPACRLADLSLPVRRCTDPGFVDELLGICREHRIDLLVPTIDPELAVLSRAAADFAAIGTRVSVSHPDVVAIARDKLRTARFLAGHGMPVPSTVPAGQLGGVPPRPFRPLIIKPRGGSSSHGIRRVESRGDWASLGDDECLGDCVAQDLLVGEEYTINLFFDASGQLRSAVPHRRIEVRGGEVAKGITERHPGLLDLAAKLGAVLPGARGALCFQAIVGPDGAPKVFEINARFGGGFPLAHRAGARFSQWLLEEVTGRPCSATDAFEQDLLMLRYDSAVFARSGAVGGGGPEEGEPS